MISPILILMSAARSSPSTGTIRFFRVLSISVRSPLTANSSRPLRVRPIRYAASAPRSSQPSRTVVFQGVPQLATGECVLFDSGRADGATGLPETVTLSGLVIRFLDGDPDPRALDAGLVLLLFLDDLTSPRARVRLADLVRQKGERPLNLRRGPGQVVQIVLADPAGTWARGAPRIELALAW
jgi:hypothetical protein